MPGEFVSFGDGAGDGQSDSPKRVLLQFRVIVNAIRAPVRPTRTPQPLAGRKLLALSMIARSPGLGVNALAASLGVRQPTSSQVVRALARLRLIEVARDGRDRRAVRIRASSTGLAVLNALPASFDFGDRLPEALAQLDTAALRRLEAELAALVEALDRTAAPLAAEDAGNPLTGEHGIIGEPHG